ncbi:MAG: GLPGLI family protein [Pedobacter sp.]|nr:MAG: GLPGLI family protein [Pedobacter sp.]
MCISILISSISWAQSPDKVLARVKYNFTHVRDSNQKNNPYTETMLLVIGKNASIYTSFDGIERDLNLQNSKSSPSAPFKPVTYSDLYYFVQPNKLITRERFMNAYYLIDEVDQQIKWKITKDTLNINGIHCKKAIAKFRGRNWIAWYAPEFPFQSGPWKLNGLPGLIIQANDDKKEVAFEFAGIDNLKKENLTNEELAMAKIYEKSMFFGNEIALQKDAKKPLVQNLIKLWNCIEKIQKALYLQLLEHQEKE